MSDLGHDILHVDWSQVRIKRAFTSLVVMLMIVAFFGVIGDVLFAALMAALFVTAAGGDGSMSERLPGMVRFTVIGAVLGGLAFLSADDGFAVASVVGVATYLGTLAAAAGPSSARAGLYLTIWPLFALMLGSSETERWTVAVAFLAGGALSIVVTAIRLRATSEDEAGEIDEPEEQDEINGERLSHPAQLAAAATSSIGIFALLRTVAVVLGVILGFWWFSAYPLWVALTVIVAVKPSASQSISVAIQRTLGTAIGVTLAVLVAQVLPSGDTAVVIAFLVSGTLMVAFNNANYTLFAAFLTATLVFGQRLVQEDAFEAGWERLLATVVGVVIAFGVIALAAEITSGHRLQTPAAD